MKKVIPCTLSAILATTIILGATPVYAQNIDTTMPVYTQTVTEESATSIEPRDAILVYTKNVIDSNGHVSVDVSYAVDTRNNKIINVQGVKNIKSVSNHYIDPVSPTLARSEVSLDKQSAEFIVKFYAKEENYPDPKLQQEYFEFNL